MSTISRTYTFTDGTTAYGSQVESEISNIVTTWNNHDGGTSIWTSLKAAALTMSGNIVMASNKLTGLAAGSANGDSARFEQLHLTQTPTEASETTGASTTGTSFIDGGASIAITPSSTSSKILVFAIAPVNGTLAGTAIIAGLSGTTTGDLFTTTTSPSRCTGTATQTLFIWKIDSPGTVSAQTYKIRLSSNGTGTATMGGAAATGAQTRIFVAEII